MIDVEVAVFGESKRGWLQLTATTSTTNVVFCAVVKQWKLPVECRRKRNNLRFSVKRDSILRQRTMV